MMPNWKELLPSILRTANDEDDENEDTNKEDVDFTEQLRSFKEGFDIYIKEEKAKANVSQSMSLERAKAGGRGIDFAVKVLREIEEGEELCKFCMVGGMRTYIQRQLFMYSLPSPLLSSHIYYDST